MNPDTIPAANVQASQAAPLDDLRLVLIWEASRMGAVSKGTMTQAIEALAEERHELMFALRLLVDRDLAYLGGYVEGGLISIENVSNARIALAKATGSKS